MRPLRTQWPTRRPSHGSSTAGAWAPTDATAMTQTAARSNSLFMALTSLTSNLQLMNNSSGLILHQFLYRLLDILRLRKDEVFEQRSVADKGVSGSDAADRCIKVFE